MDQESPAQAGLFSGSSPDCGSTRGKSPSVPVGLEAGASASAGAAVPVGFEASRASASAGAAMPWGSGASRPGMACGRSSEPWMAEPSDAPDPQGTTSFARVGVVASFGEKPVDRPRQDAATHRIAGTTNPLVPAQAAVGARLAGDKSLGITGASPVPTAPVGIMKASPVSTASRRPQDGLLQPPARGRGLQALDPVPDLRVPSA